MIHRVCSLLLCALTLVACDSRTPPDPAAEIGGAGAARADDPTAPPPAAAAQSAAARLSVLVESWFEDYLRLNPTAATSFGEHQYDDRLEIPMSAAYLDERRRLNEDYLARARAISAGELGERDLQTLELFVFEREATLARMAFPGYLLPFDHFNSLPNYFAVLGSGAGPHRFETAADYRNFISRMGDFADYASVAVARLEEGVERGVVHPRIVVERTIPQLAAQLVDPEDSIFWQPIAQLPETMPADDRAAIANAWRDALIRAVIPAYRRLHDYLAGPYLAASRDSVGFSALPDGDAWYDEEARWHTTTDMPVEKLHEVGLAEVARVRAEMEDVRRRTGFEGDLAAFFEYLKTDDRFFWPTVDAMLEDYRAMEARVSAAMPTQFDMFPRAPFEIRETEPFRAAAAAAAEYQAPSPDGSRPGIFYLNGSDLRRMPRWGMTTLFLHEAIPGHHFQGAIARELEGIPRYRRFALFTAYGEGWGLYAEDLGVELGVMDDPYQYFGKLNDEMLRAMRLVVDTGLHRKGWSREQSIAYMRENSSLPDAEIVAEVERYIAWPGQALAYKTGQLTLRRLKAEARAALGEDFDVRAWHALILTGGEMPLTMLEASQRRWLAAAGH